MSAATQQFVVEPTSSNAQCPPKMRERVPTAFELREEVLHPSVLADEANPSIMLGALSEVESSSPCQEPAREDLALRGSHVSYLPVAFSRAWQQGRQQGRQRQ